MKNLIFIVIGLLLFVGPSIYHDLYKKDVWIDGTVIAKSGEIVSHYKSTRVTTDYILAVHPDDTEKYTDFDHKVPLATYVKFNVGDKISCKEEAYYVLKNPKWYDDKGVLCIIYIFITLCGIILIILGCFSILEYFINTKNKHKCLNL